MAKTPRSIGGKAGKHGAKQVRVEFTEARKEGGGATPSRKKGGKIRKPVPTISSRRKTKKID